MKLLIVDDQFTVVDGLLEGIDWRGLGIRETFGVYSAAQAQQILREQQIDIMLCDIEMPNEDGLSLVAWIREQKLDVCVILLTAHAEFSYAQESVRLKVFEYILQPAPYAKIAEAVQRAIQAVRQKQADRRLTEYGHEYVRRQHTLVEAALWTWLGGMQNPREIQEFSAQGLLPRPEDRTFLCMIQILRWSGITNWEPALLEYALQNVFDEIFRPFGQKTLITAPQQRGQYALLLWGGEDPLPVESVRQQMTFFQWICRQYFQCEVAVYLGEVNGRDGPSPVWNVLRQMCEDNILYQAGIFLVGKDHAEEKVHFFLPQTHDWAERLQGDYPELVEKEACALLDDLIARGQMSAHTLREFYQDFLQVLYLAFDGDRYCWNKIFEQPDHCEVYRNAAHSVDNMKKLIHLAVEYIGKAAETPERELQQKVDRYIDEHMEEEIHRADLANHVYLNPDYLNRVFKQITGKSLKEYVILRKMEMARKLLRTTRLPVGIIAGRVGFAPISRFSSAYKKVYGCTPMQERKEVGQ